MKKWATANILRVGVPRLETAGWLLGQTGLFSFVDDVRESRDQCSFEKPKMGNRLRQAFKPALPAHHVRCQQTLMLVVHSVTNEIFIGSVADRDRSPGEGFIYSAAQTGLLSFRGRQRVLDRGKNGANSRPVGLVVALRRSYLERNDLGPAVQQLVCPRSQEKLEHDQNLSGRGTSYWKALVNKS